MLQAWLFCIAVFSTFFCTAVNAYTLTIGYPLWHWVGKTEFGVLHGEYLRRLNSVITLPHIVMFFSTATLVAWRPAYLGPTSAWLVAALTWTVVAVSAFLAGPVHDRFSRRGERDDAGMRALISISVARTLMMLSASALLSTAMIQGLRH